MEDQCRRSWECKGCVPWHFLG